MADKPSVKGGAEAQAFLQMLAVCSAANASASWLAEKRTDGNASNGEILKYLADGGRDITPTDEDLGRYAKIWADEVTRQLDRRSKLAATGKTLVNVQSTARAGITGGLRKAAMAYAETLAFRAKAGIDKNGVMKPVTEAYAAQRHRRHGVANDTSVVFKASLQLINNIITKRIKVRFDSAGLDNAVKILGV